MTQSLKRLKASDVPWPVGERLLNVSEHQETGSWGEVSFWRRLEFETCTISLVEMFEDSSLPPNGDYVVTYQFQISKQALE